MLKSVAFCALLLLATPSFATGACDSDSYRQFDFWLGNWQVSASNGNNKTKSSSKISKILNGCVIFEEYSTPSGFSGKSLNIYDKATQKWHQTWTDNSGLLLQLDGEWDGSAMVLSGHGVDTKKQKVLHQIRWTPEDKGQVRQVWQQSLDQGKSWQVLFDGIYQKEENTHSF